MYLRVPTIDASKLTHNAANKTMLAEASYLGFAPGRPPLGRLYDDACDVGCELLNPLNNNRTRWYLDEEETNEGDVSAWVFKPTPESGRKYPRLIGYTLIILND